MKCTGTSHVLVRYTSTGIHLTCVRHVPAEACHIFTGMSHTVTGMSCQCCIPIQVCHIHVHVSGMYRNVTLAGMPEQDQ